MKIKNILFSLSCIVIFFNNNIIGQVGEIPIMTTILGDGGDVTGGRYYADRNCLITINDALYIANLEQFEINDGTPKEYGQIFYLPTNYPEMDFNYSIGYTNGVQNIDYFIYTKAHIYENGDTVHLYSNSFEITVDVSYYCQESDSSEIENVTYNFSLVDPNGLSKFGGLSPYPLCDYVGEDDLFPCSVFGFNFCTTSFSEGPEICNDYNLTTGSRNLVVVCNEYCESDGDVENSHDQEIDNRRSKSQKNKANIYPNPFATNITIDLETKVNDNVRSIELFNTSGILIHRVATLEEMFEKRITIDLNHLSAGLYILKIDLGSSIEVMKLLKE